MLPLPSWSRWRHRRRERVLERSHKRRLHADLAGIAKSFEPRFAAAKDSTQFEDVLAEYLQACRLPDVRLEALGSRRLRQRAWDHGIRVPETLWEYDEVVGRRYLSPEGRRTLNAQIRRARLDVLREWFAAIAPLAALVLGLLGAAIGLLAVWPRT